MSICKIAWKNILLRRNRILLLVAALALGVALMVLVTQFSNSLDRQAAREGREQGIRIMLTKGNSLSGYRGVPIETSNLEERLITLQELQAFLARPGAEAIEAVAPRRYGPIVARNTRITFADPAAEFLLHPHWQLQGSFPSTGRQVLLGAQAAADLGLSIGQIFILEGLEFTVAGILTATGEDEDQWVLAPLQAIELFYPEKPGFGQVEVRLPWPQKADDPWLWARQTYPELLHGSAALQIVRIQGEDQARLLFMDTLRRFSGVLTVTVITLGCFIVFSAMMASVGERSYELGIFRAIGFTRLMLGGSILLETVIIAAVAAATGTAAGTMLAAATSTLVLPAGTRLVWDVTGLLVVSLLAVGMCLLASLYPAYIASAADPVEVLREK